MGVRDKWVRIEALVELTPHSNPLPAWGEGYECAYSAASFGA